MKAIKVKELNKYIKKYIAMDYLLSDVYVEGEISNFKEHSNGNVYLSLKDDSSKINAVIYHADYEKIEVKANNGDNVIARGSISFYEKEGIVTFFIRELKKVGAGNLYENYIALKETLSKEGLFNSEHKKKIPYFPKRVGVITSQTGAAIRDIINVLKRRNSAVDIILYPSLVQGDKAYLNLIEGLDYFSKNLVDVIIIGRGGGSFEELFAFNNEELARKIYSMEIPIISAVGHEVDYFISDFVADLRAPTPSAAAEIVSMSRDDLNNRNYLLMNRIENIIEHKIKDNKEEIKNKKRFLYSNFNLKKERYIRSINYLEKVFDTKKPKFEEKRKSVVTIKNSLDKYLINSILDKKKDINFLSKRINITKFKIHSKEDLLYSLYNSLKSKGPQVKLLTERQKLEKLKMDIDKNFLDNFQKRKYKIFELKLRLKNKSNMNIYIKDKNGKIISDIRNIKINDEIDINFDDGVVSSTVNNIKMR